ncbi:N-acetyltransferase [Aquitalea sp. S1-19]|nr:N-acetyltransferase [Aquitalea sp. S1-19]
MGNIKFREAVLTDARTLAEMHLASWRHCYGHLLCKQWLDSPSALAERIQYWEKDLQAGKKRIELAMCGDRPIALSEADRSPDANGEVFLDNLHVLPGWQGQGLGQALLARLLDTLGGKTDTRTLALTVVAENQPARAFYRAKGGNEKAGGVHQYGDGSVLSLLRVEWRDLLALRAQLGRSAG